MEERVRCFQKFLLQVYSDSWKPKNYLILTPLCYLYILSLCFIQHGEVRFINVNVSIIAEKSFAKMLSSSSLDYCVVHYSFKK
jgi:hypothetical protein